MAKENKTRSIDTEVDYDHCIGKQEKILTLFGEESATPETEEEAWDKVDQRNHKKMWKGMPGYRSEFLEAHKKLIVNFTSQEDFDEFIKILGLKKVNMKTKSTFYPEVDNREMVAIKFIDESELLQQDDQTNQDES